MICAGAGPFIKRISQTTMAIQICKSCGKFPELLVRMSGANRIRTPDQIHRNAKKARLRHLEPLSRPNQ